MIMPPSGGMGGGVADKTQYNTYQEYDDSQDMATGYNAGAYGEGGYDAAFDEEYPPQKPYPHPGIHGLQYGGDGRQYAAGGFLLEASGATRTSMEVTVRRTWRISTLGWRP